MSSWVWGSNPSPEHWANCFSPKILSHDELTEIAIERKFTQAMVNEIIHEQVNIWFKTAVVWPEVSELFNDLLSWSARPRRVSWGVDFMRIY